MEIWATLLLIAWLGAIPFVFGFHWQLWGLKSTQSGNVECGMMVFALFWPLTVSAYWTHRLGLRVADKIKERDDQ